MYVKRNYSFWMTFNWSKRPFFIGMAYAFLVLLIDEFMPVLLYIPWQPISVIGIAVAFYLGFKNNSSYDRTWEARKIWGSIVNNSRTFGASVMSLVKGENEDQLRQELMYRHIAWLTALRHQLRLSREWEHSEDRLNAIYSPTICEDYNNKLDKELSALISKEEMEWVTSKANAATQIMKIQADRIQLLCEQGYFDNFRHMEFHTLITSFYADQGKSERIKNFPFPRQYASTAVWLTFVFCAFVPFGLMDVFKNANGWLAWLHPLISGLIIWIFYLMEKIGDYSENPFEGTYNDVPITSIARGIEIDLRDMMDEEDVPPAFKAQEGFLM